MKESADNIFEQHKKTTLAVFLPLLLLFLIVVAEFLLRIGPDPIPKFDYGDIYQPCNSIPDIHFELKPGARSITKDGVEIVINSHGFRDYEFTQEKGDKYRIIAVGDSYTFNGNLALEETYAKVLEKKLQDNGLNNIEVFNFGVGMRSPLQHLRLIEHKVLQYQPDIVIWQHFSNDISPASGHHTWNWATYKQSGIKKKIAILWYKLKNGSYLYGYLVKAKIAAMSRINKSSDNESDYHKFDTSFVDYYIDEYNNESNWNFYSDTVRKASALLKDNDVRSVFLYFPPMDSITTWDDYRFGELDSSVVSFAEEAGFDSVINLTEPFMERQFGEVVSRLKEDHHISKFGAEITAERLYGVVTEIYESSE